MGKPFNVVLVQPAGYAFSQALAEAVEYVASMLRACGEQAQVGVNALRANAHNVVFCGHLMNRGDIAQLPADTIVFNSEPLARQDHWHLGGDVYREALARHHVWDYAQRNLDTIPHARKDALPFWYCRDLVRARPPAGSGPLLFYGVPTPWRRTLLREIVATGIEVQFMHNAFGPQRDAVMWNAWAVLNLHKTEDSAVFEPIRCFYPLINRVPVISEDVQDGAEADAFRDAMFFFSREGIARAIGGLRDDPVRFCATTEAQFAAFERKSAVEQFRAAIARYREGLAA